MHVYIYMSLVEFGLWRNTAFAGVTQSYCYWGVAQSCAAAGALAWLLTPEAVEVITPEAVEVFTIWCRSFQRPTGFGADGPASRHFADPQESRICELRTCGHGHPSCFGLNRGSRGVRRR